MLFSVITVTRNNLEGLMRTATSLERQTLQAFEWIVIDGASDDGTETFLETSPARWISEPDKGIYDAMNKGIDRASGFFLLFLNAGDALADDDTMARLAAYIEDIQETPDFIYGDALEERPGKSPVYKTARPYKKSAHGMFTHHQAMLYRRDLAGGLRYDCAYKIAADYKFTLECLDRSRTVVYCPFALCLFESGGISQQKTAQGRDEQWHIRHQLGTISPLKNELIRQKQKAAQLMRRLSPSLYWQIRSSGNSENGRTRP